MDQQTRDHLRYLHNTRKLILMFVPPGNLPIPDRVETPLGRAFWPRAVVKEQAAPETPNTPGPVRPLMPRELLDLEEDSILEPTTPCLDPPLVIWPGRLNGWQPTRYRNTSPKDFVDSPVQPFQQTDAVHSTSLISLVDSPVRPHQPAEFGLQTEPTEQNAPVEQGSIEPERVGQTVVSAKPIEPAFRPRWAMGLLKVLHHLSHFPDEPSQPVEQTTSTEQQLDVETAQPDKHTETEAAPAWARGLLTVLSDLAHNRPTRTVEAFPQPVKGKMRFLERDPTLYRPLFGEKQQDASDRKKEEQGGKEEMRPPGHYLSSPIVPKSPSAATLQPSTEHAPSDFRDSPDGSPPQLVVPRALPRLGNSPHPAVGALPEQVAQTRQRQPWELSWTRHAAEAAARRSMPSSPALVIEGRGVFQSRLFRTPLRNVEVGDEDEDGNEEVLDLEQDSPSMRSVLESIASTPTSGDLTGQSDFARVIDWVTHRPGVSAAAFSAASKTERIHADDDTWDLDGTVSVGGLTEAMSTIEVASSAANTLTQIPTVDLEDSVDVGAETRDLEHTPSVGGTTVAVPTTDVERSADSAQAPVSTDSSDATAEIQQEPVANDDGPVENRRPKRERKLTRKAEEAAAIAAELAEAKAKAPAKKANKSKMVEEKAVVETESASMPAKKAAESKTGKEKAVVEAESAMPTGPDAVVEDNTAATRPPWRIKKRCPGCHDKKLKCHPDHPAAEVYARKE